MLITPVYAKGVNATSDKKVVFRVAIVVGEDKVELFRITSTKTLDIFVKFNETDSQYFLFGCNYIVFSIVFDKEMSFVLKTMESLFDKISQFDKSKGLFIVSDLLI